jgi:YD repeat-containing protein
VGVNYSDSTPDVGYTYNRRGELTAATNGPMVTAYYYNDAGQKLGESYSGGVLSGLSITNRYDGLSRRSSVAALRASPAAVLATNSFAYDGASRLTNVTDGSVSAAYGYVANSPLVETVTFRQSGTTRLTTTKSYDYLNLWVAKTSSRRI